MRPPSEQLRYILRYGRITRIDEGWMFTAAPGVDFMEMRCPSKWDLVQRVYDLLRGNDVNYFGNQINNN